MKLYLIGSLRNPAVPLLAAKLREDGHEVFDDWYAAGPKADDHWMEYEQARGHTFAQALEGHAAKHVYEYDRSHLDESAAGVLLAPAGKSGHLEAGYLVGKGKPVWVLLPGEPDRFDVMYRFFTGVYTDEAALREAILTSGVCRASKAYAAFTPSIAYDMWKYAYPDARKAKCTFRVDPAAE